MEKKLKEQTSLQKFVRACQYGVIGSLEKFFTWYGCLIATYPKTAILACVSVTIAGGLGLLRFYEEGDAASMVIPRNSVFRKNIDWLDENFPREIRVHSVLFTAENVLTSKVMQTIFKQRKKLEELKIGEKSFQDFCIQVPVLKLPAGGLSACNRENTGKTTTGWGDFEEDDWAPFWEVGINDTELQWNETTINNINDTENNQHDQNEREKKRAGKGRRDICPSF